MGERVTSRAHYAAFFADVVRCLNHPELMENQPGKVRYDKNVEYHVPKIQPVKA